MQPLTDNLLEQENLGLDFSSAGYIDPFILECHLLGCGLQCVFQSIILYLVKFYEENHIYGVNF